VLVFNDDTAVNTGAAIDGANSGSFETPEIPGLFITIHSLGSGGGVLNATGSQFGINSDIVGGGDNTSLFDTNIGEIATFSLNKDVTISVVSLTSLGNTDQFEFAGTLITAANSTSGVYTYSTPLAIAAGTQFSLEATSGSVGLASIELDVVPEPTTVLLGAIGLLTLLRRRK
jgi:hypothetical protein